MTCYTGGIAILLVNKFAFLKICWYLLQNWYLFQVCNGGPADHKVFFRLHNGGGTERPGLIQYGVLQQVKFRTPDVYKRQAS